MSRAKGGLKGPDAHVPARTCVVCRAVKDKRDLLRFVSIDGVLTFDKDSKMPGRGAYICRSEACFNGVAVKKGVFSRALRTASIVVDIRSLKTQIPES